MGEVTIKTEDKPKEEEQAKPEDIKETLRKADEYQKLKEENDKLEAEYLRQQELKAKIKMSGDTIAGQHPTEKTEEQKVEEEASKILETWKHE